MLASDATSANSLWPVVLAGLALLFDLVFVWHRYIRHEVGIERLTGKKRRRKQLAH